MAKTKPELIEKRINEIILDYSDKRIIYENAARRLIEDLSNDAPLYSFIHSTKYRSKDPEHLRGKLIRKADLLNLKSEAFKIAKNNYEETIEDLAGCRLLHIHTKQFEIIHSRIIEILKFHNYELVREPVSYTWDIENKRIFENLGIEVIQRDSFYTSTHYIIKSPAYPAKCELQVRTLSEELWGEVSHKINYPNNIESVSCREQLLALARFTSGCSRLVDSLFASKKEYAGLTEEVTKEQGDRS